MNVLIINDEINDGFLSESKYEPSSFELVINTSLQQFSFDNIHYEFKNIIELIQLLEKNEVHIDELVILTGILNYSSEINIRVLFSGFSNIVKSRFTYVDTKTVFNNKLFLVNRCFFAIGKMPNVYDSGRLTTLTFENSENSWLNFSSKHMHEKIEKNRIPHSSLLSCIKEAIKNKSAFSFVRLNHCENRLIGQGITFPKEEADITYKRQFGFVLNEEDTNYISHRIKASVKGADIIGVPDKKPNTTDKLHLLENTTFFHLANFSLVKNQSFINVNTHYYLGQSEEFKDILKSCMHLVAITCRDVKELRSSLDRSIDVLKIPAQSHFSDNLDEAEKHFPDRFFDIEKEIKKIVNPGSVVLIGAGILGKIYCDIVKNSGGIALDVGSLMDAIAKKDTRGVGFESFDFWWN